MGMTNRQLATLAVKLLGVYCVMQLVGTIPGILAWARVDEPLVGLDAASTWTLQVGFAVTVAAHAVLAILLIWRSGWFVRLVAPDGAQAAVPGEGKDDARAFQGVLFSVVGLLLIAFALPELVSTLFSRLALRDPATAPPDRWFTTSLVRVGVELALGVALFLSGGGLARFWQRVNEMKRLPT